MRIEKITENTIKVTLAAKDFESRGIETAKIKFNSPACQELLWDIIDHAEIEMGLNGLGDRIIVETVADSQGNCVITVTRSEDPNKLRKEDLKHDRNEDNDSDMEDLLDALFETPNQADSGFNREPEVSRYNDYIVFCFPDFESLIEAVGHCSTPKAIPSKLYTYNGDYYLVLSISERNFYTYLRFEEVCYEFNGSKADTETIMPILQEHGKPLMRRSAIQSLINKFNRQ